MRHAAALLGAFAAVCVAARPALVRADAARDYAERMATELRALGLDPRCEVEDEAAARCSFSARSSLTERAFNAHALYSEPRRSVLIYVEHYLDLPPEHPSTPTLLARMMELNAQMRIGKLGWNPHTGEVRLSATVPVGADLDTAAFRATVRELDTLSARYAAELASLKHASDPP